MTRCFRFLPLLVGLVCAQSASAAPTGVSRDWGEPDEIELDAVDAVITVPPVAISEDGSIPAAIQAAGTPIAGRGGVFPRMEEPTRNGALSIVRMLAPRYGDLRGAADWLRFFTSTPEIPAYLEACVRTSDQPSVGPRLVDSFLLAPTGTGYHYEVFSTWLDAGTCSGVVLDHYDASLTPIADGAAFLYRTSCPDCAEPRREMAHLLVPPHHHSRLTADASSFAYWTYQLDEIVWSIEPGHAGTFEADLNPDDLQGWNRLLAEPRSTDAIRIQIDTDAPKKGAAHAWVRTKAIQAWLP
jgi:hypothetical protein